jgi:hypothetical protein
MGIRTDTPKWRLSAAMLVRISDAALLTDLCLHFLRSGFAVEEAGGTMIEVARPDAPNRGQERREVELHLAVWQATHPDVKAELIE